MAATLEVLGALLRKPDAVTTKSRVKQLLKALINRSGAITTKSEAKQLHAQILKFNPSSPVYISSAICVYSNFNLLRESILLFDTLQFPPSLAYKSIVRCYAVNGLFVESLSSFIEMRASGIKPDEVDNLAVFHWQRSITNVPVRTSGSDLAPMHQCNLDIQYPLLESPSLPSSVTILHVHVSQENSERRVEVLWRNFAAHSRLVFIS
ncbi:Putative pentatricopeptide repeat-containing protein At3g23330 [Linum grandiflorum]